MAEPPERDLPMCPEDETPMVQQPDGSSSARNAAGYSGRRAEGLVRRRAKLAEPVGSPGLDIGTTTAHGLARRARRDRRDGRRHPVLRRRARAAARPRGSARVLSSRAGAAALAGRGLGVRQPDRPLAIDGPQESAGQAGGGCEIRTREGLPPTRFPSLRTGVRGRPAPSATLARGPVRSLVNVAERWRMRPKLRLRRSETHGSLPLPRANWGPVGSSSRTTAGRSTAGQAPGSGCK
jgi:hypothetical protein